MRNDKIDFWSLFEIPKRNLTVLKLSWNTTEIFDLERRHFLQTSEIQPRHEWLRLILEINKLCQLSLFVWHFLVQ